MIFLAFANERKGDDRRYLLNLPEEKRRVRTALAASEAAGHCKVIIRYNATLPEIFDVFQEHRDRVAVFHFGGHTGNSTLQVETATGSPALVSADGLAAFLGHQHGLKLVFLNGCFTARQVDSLLEAGVASVIATSEAIVDSVATEFAARFYKSLASGASLATAYYETSHALQAQEGNNPRSYYRRETPAATTESRWPWGLFTAPWAEETTKTWSLASAAHDPLWGLPRLPEIDLPSSPFKYLSRFSRKDAPVFFGRGTEIRHLYDAVTAPGGDPVVLLYGATGVGKSSLLDAGLRPRLEASHKVVYLRRDGHRGLVASLAAVFGDVANLKKAWHQQEAERPCVVILDQLEEAWTRPLPKGNEVEELARTLNQIFAVQKKRPHGRLILGFRKEWLAEVRELLTLARVPFRPEPLRHLDHAGIKRGGSRTRGD